jgi:tetratricopeptide (TPR) repeat protein
LAPAVTSWSWRCATLRDAGADVWYDQHNMEAGRLGHTIEEQVRDRPVFVLVLSPAALGSRWVEDKARCAYNLARKGPKRIILPVVCAAVKEEDIWLFLGDFRRIETGANQPFPPPEAIRQTLRVLTLTPAGQASVTPTPRPGESLAGLFVQGNALLARKQLATALPFFEQAALTDADSCDVWFNLGYTRSRLQRTTEALRAYERATKPDPNNVLAWGNMSSVLTELKRDHEALLAIVKALALDSNFAYAWNHKGNTLRLIGRYDEAMQAVDRSLALDQRNAAAWTTKGEILNDQRRYGEALPYLETALTMDEQLLDAWRAKAAALRAPGREAEAQEAER